jgi:hypothetical protein
LVKLCTAGVWHYVLRVCAEHTGRRYHHGKLEPSWKRFGQIVLKPGYYWYGKAQVWKEDRSHLDRLLLALFLAMWLVSHKYVYVFHARERINVNSTLIKDSTHKWGRHIWQRRMGVEPTRDRAERPPSRFEDGETHRGPYTSI